jgi:tetratricopeptide (TPR) repeat protein
MSSMAAAVRRQLVELADRVGSDPGHPLVPELLALARTGDCRSELQHWLDVVSPALVHQPSGRLLEVCETAAALGLVEVALDLAQRASCAAEPEVAAQRGAWAMQLGRHELALRAADAALAGLLQPGLAVEEFLLLVARGAPPEGLLRYGRDDVARRASLREPIALRWEAARRLGLAREANLMRLLCLRYFPERASVWATAGNQSLDEGDLATATGYFRRCLALNPDWTAALAGMAIVLEQQKDWEAALPFRRRVVEVERALEHDAPASLQRVLRYAAALARLGRWHEAQPLFRRCVALGAYASLPAERPVLERVFSRELYAPALIAGFRAGMVAAEVDPPPEIALALHEALLLPGLYRQLDAARDAPLRGMCAWLAGDVTHAYALFDEAELANEDDVLVQYFLLDTARALAAPELPSIERYATESAERVLAGAAQASEEAGMYALLTLERLAAPPADASALLRPGVLGLAALHATAPELAGPLLPHAGDWRDGLRRITAFRASLRARGASPLTAAALSSQALVALCEVAAAH